MTTLSDSSSAEALVRTLVDERLIACGNVLPGLSSIYRWQDEVAHENEVMVVMKLAAFGVERLFARVAALHPYTVPELVELPIGAVSGPYSRWVVESTKVVA